MKEVHYTIKKKIEMHLPKVGEKNGRKHQYNSEIKTIQRQEYLRPKKRKQKERENE